MIGFSRTCRLASAALASGFCLLGSAGTALADQSSFTLALTPNKPAALATLKLHIVYRKPSDPNGKPSPIRHLVFHLPPGMAINTGRVPACTASNQQIQAQGPSACPANSQVGSGTLTAITGFGPPIDPFVATVAIFNDGQGWIEVIEPQQAGAAIAVDRLQANGDTLTGNPPATPGGPPDGQTAVRAIDFTFPARERYITTPPRCPKNRRWNTTAAFTFADGTTQQTSATSPCHGAGHNHPAIRLSATPRRVHTGIRTIHFRVRSKTARCRRGDLIRLAGRHTRTGPRGHATLQVRLNQPGRYHAHATKPRCRPANTTITATGR